MIDTAANSLPQVRAGTIKALHGKGPLGSGTRYPNRRPGWALRVLRPELASDIHAQGHAP
jgi:hypothetical protein